MKSKSRQQLDKLHLRHLKRQQHNQNSQPMMDNKRDEEFLSTRLNTTIKPLFASDVTQLVDYEGFHPDKEEELKKRDDNRITVYTKSDWFESPFKGLFSRMPAFGDFLLTTSVKELARTPRHSPSELNDPTEDPRAGQLATPNWQLATETSPHWITALATLSPDQVLIINIYSCVFGAIRSMTQSRYSY